MNFKDYIQQYNINHASEFSTIAQAIIAWRYLVPYPDQKDIRQENKINRPYHGGFHASSTVVNLLMLMELYQKYRPELLISPDNKPLQPRQIKLLMLAALCHDAANSSETSGPQAEQAVLYREDMLDLGFTEEELAPFVSALLNKDNPNQCNDIYTSLIHDADCLDYMRMLTDIEKFNRQFLYIYNLLLDNPIFLTELNTIIRNLFHTLSIRAEGELSEFHKRCEKAVNCYEAFLNGRYEQAIEHALLQQRLLDRSQLRILDLYTYDPQSSPRILSAADEEKTINLTMKNIRESGCFIRVIKSNDLRKEFAILDSNKNALNQQNITDVTRLRAFILEQTTAHPTAPTDFLWRPCSYYENGLPLKLYNSDSIILLINARQDSGTFASFFYKTNAVSDSTAFGLFNYNARKGKLKDKASLENLRSKLHEMDARRCGIIPDLNLHYFGKKMLSWPEILVHYDYQKDVIGIAIPEGKQLAREALIAQTLFGNSCPIFSISETQGLQPIRREEILSEFGHLNLEEYISYLNHKLSMDNSMAFRLGQMTSYDFRVKELELDMPAIRFELECDLTKLRPELRDKIIDALIDLRKYKPNSINETNNIIDLEVIQTEESICISVSTLADMEPDLINFMSTCLKGIYKSSSSEIEASNLAFQKSLIDTLLIAKIGDISCPVSSGTISKDNPLSFTFFHPIHLDVFCIAHVVDGNPLITFLSKGTSINIETTLLPDIALEYYKQRIKLANSLFSHNNVQKCLLKHGIEYLHMQLRETGEKLFLEIQINGIGDIDTLICELLQLTNNHKFIVKDLDDQKYLYEIPYIHNIDCILQHPILLNPLQAELNSLIRPQDNQHSQISLCSVESNNNSRTTAKHPLEETSLERSNEIENTKNKNINDEGNKKTTLSEGNKKTKR